MKYLLILLFVIVLNAQHVITSFSPSFGPIGTSITITGENFHSDVDSNIVLIDNIKATIQTASATELTFTVPQGVAHGRILVISNNRIAQSRLFFSTTFDAIDFVTSNGFDTRVNTTTSGDAGTMNVADFDNDGLLDVFVNAFYGFKFQVFRNTSSGAGNFDFASSIDLTAGQFAGGLHAIDMDADGKLDLIGLDNTNINLYRNTSPSPGTISFAARQTMSISSQNVNNFNIADFDGDGKMDFGISRSNPSTQIVIYQNTSTGTGDVDFSIVDTVATSSLGILITSDLDSDGLPDLIVNNSPSNEVVIYRNTSTQIGEFSFASSVEIAGGENARTIDIADLDNDSKLDMVVGNWTDSTLSIFRNTSSGPGSISFDSKQDHVTGLHPIGVEIGDLNGDGLVDISVMSRDADAVYTYTNKSSGPGNITFTEPSILAAENDGYKVRLADMDIDGKVDILTTNNSTRNFSIFRNILPKDSNLFITTWQTDNEGDSEDNQIMIPTEGGGYDYYVDWGDGTISSNVTEDTTHTYASAGTYTVKIFGDFPRIFFNNEGDRKKLLSIEQWGSIEWASMSLAFYGCDNITIPAIDTPDLTGVTDLSFMFAWIDDFNANLNHWDVSNVTDLSAMFIGARSFNSELNNWDVSNVTNMGSLFSGNYSFNSDISMWDVANVESMYSMFSGAIIFNQDISNWNTNKNKNLYFAFGNAYQFNQDISSWDVSNVEQMSSVFIDANSFDQDLGDWDISSVTTMTFMFNGTGLSSANYDSTLAGWSILDAGEAQIPTNITLGAEGQIYSSETHRNELINTYNWTIEGDLPDSSAFFVTTWKTDNPGTSNNNQITIPTEGAGYNYYVDWGDGNTTDSITGDITHTYDASGTYTVRIFGDFPRIYFNDSGDKEKIISIDQWGTIQWTSMNNAFNGTPNLGYTAVDIPNLSNVTDLSSMFKSSSFNGDIGNWDVSTITDISALFLLNSSFNQNINDWDVSNVTTLRTTFKNATSFNQPLDNWVLTKNTSLYQTFQGATNFAQDISGWDVSNVITMNGALRGLANFNAPIGSWNVSKVTNMQRALNDMGTFNQDISSWDVSNVNDFLYIFSGSSEFNQDISSWNVSKVTNFGLAFLNATSFNQDLGSWNIKSAATMTQMFNGTAMSTTNYDNTIIGWSQNDSIPDDIELGADGLTYSYSDSARSALITNNNWTFVGDTRDPSAYFITTWKTDNTGESDDNQIRIPTEGSGYNYTIDWGDGETYEGVTGDTIHTYASAGTYTVKIFGQFPRIYFANSGDKDKIVTIEQWGHIKWTSFVEAFRGCANLTMPATDTPDLSHVTELRQMFENNLSMTGDFSSWDVSTITDFSLLFYGNFVMNSDISSWNVSKATNMSYMFINAHAFNQDISTWDVDSVTDFSYMFWDTHDFNQDISSWDVGSGEDFSGMFGASRAFNQDISSWDMTSATLIDRMFEGALAFNQNISSWDIPSITTLTQIFMNATAYDQPFGDIDISNITMMNNLFDGSNLSYTNYDSTLIDWANQASTPTNITLGADGVTYDKDSARNELINTYNWTITGDKFQGYVQDSLALVALYNSTNGDSWSASWNINNPMTTWSGVTMQGNRVTKVDLSNKNLTGTLPIELGNLTELTELNLYSNNISDTIPDALYTLTKLTNITMNNNQLTGSLSPNIGNLTNLVTLFLSGNEITGPIPDEITTLSNLTGIYFDGLNLTGTIPAGIWNMTQLVNLGLNNNSLEGPIPVEIGNLVNLEYLILSGNNFTDTIPKEIGNLVNVYFLSMDDIGEGVYGSIPPEMGHMANLDILYLNGNNLTGEVPESFGNLKKLTYLGLGDNQLSGALPDSIATISTLETISLYENNFTSVPSFGHLLNLQNLYLRNNNFDFDDIERNIGVAQNSYNYSNQGLVGMQRTDSTQYDDPFDLVIPVGGDNNTYQWYKDNSIIDGATNDTLHFDSFSVDDEASYHIVVNNTLINDLILTTQPVDLFGYYTPRKSDSLALVDIYNATGGDNWTTSWNLENDMSTWNGVQLNNGRVRSLSLQNNNLVDSLPTSIGNLTELEYFIVSYNQNLTGTLPDEIYQLTNMKDLWLRSTDLTIEIKDEIATMINLKILSISYTNFIGNFPDIITTMPSLRVIHFDALGFTGPLPDAFWDMNYLEEFSLSFNELEGEISTKIGDFTNLRYMGMDGNKFTGTIPSEIGNLNSLITIYANDNDFSGELPDEIGNLPKIEYLYFERNNFQGAIPTTFENLDSLRNFDISVNNFDSLPTFQTLTNLDEFIIENNQFEFDDIERNIGAASSLYDYIPQDSIGQSSLDSALFDESHFITIPIGGDNNTYQWFKDGEALPGKTNDTLYFESFNQTDVGYYGLAIENTVVNDLTLNTRQIFVDGFYTPRKEDSLALVAFYIATDSANWNTKWDLNDPMDSWHGIDLFEGRVTSIDMSSNNLTGSLPDELGSLTELYWLALSSNNLTGSIPETFSNLVNLGTLILGHNNYSGSFPSVLFDIPNLNQLILNLNEFSGSIPKEIGTITNLFNLDLSNNNFTDSIPSEIGNLSSLLYLHLNGNDLSGEIPSSIWGVSSLRTFNLSNNSINGTIPPEIGNLTDLVHFILGTNSLNDSLPSEIGLLSKLETLNLTNNNFSGKIPESIQNNDSLQLIHIFNNQFDSLPSLQTLDKLDNLNISSNRFEFDDIERNIGTAQSTYGYSPQDSVGVTRIDTVLFDEPAFITIPVGGENNTYQWLKGDVTLDGMTADTLKFDSFSAEDEGDYRLVINNTIADELTLYSRKISLHGTYTPRKLDSLSLIAFYEATGGDNWTTSWNLENPMSTWHGVTIDEDRVVEISLYNNNLVDSLPSEIGALTELTHLVLSNNQLEGSIPEEFWNLTNLVQLSFFANNFSGSLSVNVEKLSNIQHLSLEQNNFTGAIPTEIGNLANIQTISIGNNEFTGEIPTSIGNLTKLISLYLSLNQLTGTIPTSFSNLGNLRTLALSHNDLDGSIPEAIWNLPSLEMIDVVTNRFSGEISTSIENLSNLKYLYLDGNSFEGTIPTEIGTLDSIRQITLSQNSFSGKLPFEIGNLTNLNTLSLFNNEFGGAVPSSFENLTLLEHMYLNDNKFDSLPTFQALTNLENLGIQRNKLEFDDIERNNNIANNEYTYSDQDTIGTEQFLINEFGTSFNFSFDVGGANNTYKWYKDDNAIEGETANTLNFADFDNDDQGVYYLEIKNTVITDLTLETHRIHLAGVTSLRETDSLALVTIYDATDGDNWSTSWALDQGMETWTGVTIINKRITRLDLSNNELSGTLDADLSILSELTMINLSNNTLTGSVPTSLLSLSKVDTLLLNNNQFNGTLPSGISQLTELDIFDVSENQLSGELPSSIGNLGKIRELFLHSNSFEGSIPPEFGTLSTLEDITLNDNMLTGTVPSELGSLSNLQDLFLFNNALRGAIPQSFQNLSNLEELKIEENQFDSIPDLTSLLNLTDLTIYSNQFQFDDIERNVGAANVYLYSPQDSIGDAQTFDVQQNGSQLLTSNVAGTNNTYQWFFNGSLLVGETGSTLNVTSFDQGKVGDYSLEIKNTVATNLTLFTRPIRLRFENSFPTDVTYSAKPYYNTYIPGELVGTFASVDANILDEHSYALAAGVGDTDNLLFRISNDSLFLKASQSADTYSIRVATLDGRGGFFSKQIAVTVLNNNAPFNFSFNPGILFVSANPDTMIGKISAQDTEGHLIVYSLVDGDSGEGSDNNKFYIRNDSVFVNSALSSGDLDLYFEARDEHNAVAHYQYDLEVRELPEDEVVDILASGIGFNQSTGINNQPSNFTSTTLNLNLSTGVSGTINSLVIRYREIGESDWDSEIFDISNLASSSAALDLLGYDASYEYYFVITIDGTEYDILFKNTDYFTSRVSTTSEYIINLDPKDVGTDFEKNPIYNLISIPFQNTLTLGDLVTFANFGTERKDFVFYYWTGTEFAQATESTTLSDNKVLFYASKRDSIIKIPAGKAARLTRGHEIESWPITSSLSESDKKWSIVANPYTIEFTFAELKQMNPGVSIFMQKYSDSFWDPVLDTDKIKPNVGYALSALNTTSISIPRGQLDLSSSKQKRYDKTQITLMISDGKSRTRSHIIQGEVGTIANTPKLTKRPDIYFGDTENKYDVISSVDENLMHHFTIENPLNAEVELSITDNMLSDWIILNPARKIYYTMNDNMRFNEKYTDLIFVSGSQNFLDDMTSDYFEKPTTFYVDPPYPNPFNPTVNVNYALSRSERVNIVVYNVLGQRIKVLERNSLKDIGYHKLQWNGQNDRNEKVSSGVYFIIIESQSKRSTQKVIMAK